MIRERGVIRRERRGLRISPGFSNRLHSWVSRVLATEWAAGNANVEDGTDEDVGELGGVDDGIWLAEVAMLARKLMG
jgi:hypothetical protein